MKGAAIDLAATRRSLLDDPDAFIRAGDVLGMLDTDNELARAIAQHHGLLADSEPRERETRSKPRAGSHG